MSQDTPLGLSDVGLGGLGERNDWLKRQVEGFSKAAKAKGGVGTNKHDETAQEFAEKQVQVEGEIFDRLFDIHQDRSERAQNTDERKKAPIADGPEEWASHPDQYDWPGIDTPRR